jgi:hypothetical protein
MAAYDDLLTNEHAPEMPVPSAEFNSIVNLLSQQLTGALRGVGEGCLTTDSWVVTAGDGLDVDVSAGAGITDLSDGYAYMETSGSSNVADLDPNSTLYLYAQGITREEVGEPDSREDASFEFLVRTTGGSVAGALLLAKITTSGAGVTEVVDEREYITAVQALASVTGTSEDLAAVEAAIGSDYFGETPPAASLDARVDDMEAAGTIGNYWGALGKAAGDPTTVDQTIDGDVAAHVATYHQDEDMTFFMVPQAWDVDAVNQARAALMVTRRLDPDHPENHIDAVVIVWGVYGDGSGETPDFVDRVNSTWLPAA